jgi:hypothetical protein
MDQRIFDLKLSVEATSLYLLLVALSDAGTPLNQENAARFWNSPLEQLGLAFTELVAQRVLGADPDGSWFIRPSAQWQRATPA